MKVCFNGWFGGFLDKTNPGVHVDFFIRLFENIYGEQCEVGSLDESDILCEFDMLFDFPGTLVEYKKWKQTYLFTGESSMRCNPNNYDIVLWGERNHKNIVNMPLFVPYIYTNNFVDKLSEPKPTSTLIPQNEVCVIISNPHGEIRNMFLNKLEQNFNVTYAGLYKNNIGGNLPYDYNTPEFIEFIRTFKFIVSMENSRNDTYISEKIIHGLLANVIPVYWGSTRVFDYFNPNRFLYLENENTIDNVIEKMKELNENNDKWLDIVNQSNYTNNKLDRTIENIANDVRCLIHKNKKCWNNISRVYCVNNPEFEPYRYYLLKNMFKELNIDDDYISYISPTYKTTITEEIYNKYTSNQLVKYLRPTNLNKGELSLFLNYKAVLENIEKNYKDGLFLILESDVMVNNINKFNDFLNFIWNKDFDLINIGECCDRMFSNNIYNFPTGYRIYPHNNESPILEYCRINENKNGYIEDIANETDEFRIIRKFYANSTDSYLWKYSGIVKFLDFMKNFEDYSSPFDYYMTNFFEKNINFKHYWLSNDIFKQGSNLGLIESTLKYNQL